jgi:hypothetical protein
MKELLDAYTAAVVENADYAREIEHLHDLIENRDEEVDTLRAELARLKTMPPAA